MDGAGTFGRAGDGRTTGWRLAAAACLVATACSGAGGGHASATAGATPPGSDSDLSLLAPEGLVPAGPVERFDAATLYEKIDGKANVYLAAGFVGLQCRRFRDAGGNTAEICAYRMDDPRSAFAVFGEQRPPDARALATVPDACESDRLTLLARGRDFVEIAGEPGPRGEEVRRRLAGAFAAGSTEAAWNRPRPPFPARGRVDGGDRLLRRDGFGFAGFSDVFVARYRLDGAEATAFWAPRDSGNDARTLAASYAEHLRNSGARPLEADVGLPGARVMDVFGSIEVIAATDRAAIGVHQADSLEAARTLASALRQAIESADR